MRGRSRDAEIADAGNLINWSATYLAGLIHPQGPEEVPIWTPLKGKPQEAGYLSDADVVGYGGSAGSGKLLALDTPIPTPSGWTTMGQIEVGDLIFDDQGQVVNVTCVSPIQFDTTYRLVFSDGSAITSGASHQWVTETEKDRMLALRRDPKWRAARRARRPSRGSGKRPDLAERNRQQPTEAHDAPELTVKTTQEIVDTLYGRGRRLNHSIVVCRPLELPIVDLPLDPYVLGAWLGDGSSYGQGLTCADAEIMDQVRAAGHEVVKWKHGQYAYGIHGIQKHLREMHLLANKHIPSQYLRASVDQRLALLQGLMDTDGYATLKGDSEFTTTNIHLASGMEELLISLGIKVVITTGRAMLYGKDCGAKYRLRFLTELPVFRLLRKLERQKRSGFCGRHNRRYIAAAELVTPVPMRCIAVDSPNHLYLAGRAMIPTHNSDLLLGKAFTKHRSARIFRSHFADLGDLVERGNEIQDGRSSFVWGNTRAWRTLDQRMIQLGAIDDIRDFRKYRGRPVDFLGIDEAAEFPELVVRFLMGWVRTTIKTQKTQTMLTFNPPMTPEGEWVIRFFAPWLDPDHPHPAQPGEIRYYARLNDEDVEVEDDHLIDVGGGVPPVKPQSRTFIPGRVTDNPYLMATDYPAQLNALPEPLRSQLLFGDFNIKPKDNPWQVIPADWIRQAQARWTPERPDLALRALGVDASRGGGDQSVIASIFGNWIAPLDVYPGKDVPDGVVLAKLVEDHLMGQAIAYIDVVGIGTSPYDILRMRKRRVFGVHFGKGSKAKDKTKMLGFANLRAEAYWRVREMLDPRSDWEIALPPDRELFVDLTAPRYSAEGKVIQVEPKDDIKDRIGRSPDKGDAVVMLLWGIQASRDLIIV